MGKAKALPLKAALLWVSRRRPTLPPGFPGSTIGAGGLNFRVRNGAGCIPSAITTETAWEALEVGNPQSYTASASKKMVAKSSAY
jgi:hypothetical protein